jgi:hypothetical protein
MFLCPDAPRWRDCLLAVSTRNCVRADAVPSRPVSQSELQSLTDRFGGGGYTRAFMQILQGYLKRVRQIALRFFEGFALALHTRHFLKPANVATLISGFEFSSIVTRSLWDATRSRAGPPDRLDHAAEKFHSKFFSTAYPFLTAHPGVMVASCDETHVRLIGQGACVAGIIDGGEGRRDGLGASSLEGTGARLSLAALLGEGSARARHAGERCHRAEPLRAG